MPRTNGKAGPFIQIFLRQGACARPDSSSDERAAAIKPWTNDYTLNRPHSGIKRRTRVNSLPGNDN